ncbi:MAG: acyl-CoA dehydrogenase, partial [Hyphomicrobiales bacterium]
KLGLHASPTCVMAYGEDGGAVGYLVGQEHTGLAAMFTMMNNARLLIGMQGVGIADRAFQQALSFASERRQGRKPGDPVSTSIATIEHVDVRRMLTTMAALTGAARGICLVAAVAIDAARHGDDDEARAAHQARADLLIPIAKAFSTDIGVEVASLGVQVHGGMGYMEETGAAQHYRDARIAPIYEGTNGIQAIDLVTRKLARDNGRAAQAFIDEARGVAEEIMTSNSPRFGKMGYRLVEAIDALDEATDWLLQTGSSEPRAALAGATPYLRLFGLVAGGAYLARGALVAERDGDSGPPEMRNQQIALARYFAENHLPEATGQARVVTDGAQALLDYELVP